MIVADLNQVAGRKYEAGRHTRAFAGPSLALPTQRFCMGYVELEPAGGQVPWHEHDQEEVYLILEGTCEMCLGNDRRILTRGQAVHIPAGTFHQLTNMAQDTARMIYCYAPAGDVAHWRQELDGTLPHAGRDAPSLPEGAHPQWPDKAP